jgi:hypothetical protein
MQLKSEKQRQEARRRWRLGPIEQDSKTLADFVANRASVHFAAAATARIGHVPISYD